MIVRIADNKKKNLKYRCESRNERIKLFYVELVSNQPVFCDNMVTNIFYDQIYTKLTLFAIYCIAETVRQKKMRIRQKNNKKTGSMRIESEYFL